MKPATDDVIRVARKLWGDPNKALSNRNELRFGAHGSKSLDLRALRWFDHEAGQGGGYVKLFEMADEPLPEKVADAFITTTYDYRDERGVLLFQVVRMPNKKFRQRRPTAGAPGTWTWSIKGTRRVLYRLPELLAADADAIVFIPEGEKDVDNLRAIGVTATCNSGGAGKWEPEYLQHLRGRGLVILPDNDQPGRDHADMVVRALAGAARSVKVLALPDLPVKGDVSDWIAAGGTREKLLELVEATPETKPAPGIGTSGNGADAHAHGDSATRRARGDGAAEPADGVEISEEEAEKEIQRLAALTQIRYARQRTGSAKLLGVPVGILDRLVRTARGDDIDTKGQGRPLELPAIAPWPEPVDGVALCSELAELFATYAKLPDRGPVALALWAIHTHCFAIWRHTPRLHVTAPTKRSGKSRVLRLLQLVVSKPIPTSNISAAALYRCVEALHPTLLIDEADLSVNDNPDLVRVLDGGYERGQVSVLAVGEENEARMFDLFAPVALAGIGRLRGQLEDRSIQLAMRRALPTDRPPKITEATEQQGERLQRQIARWVADHRAAIEAAQPDVSALPDRVDDNWTPLWAIASVVGDNWPLLAQRAATALTPQDDDTDTLSEKLIHDIHAVFSDRSCDWISSHELVTALVEMEGRPWAELGRSAKPLTSQRLARLLAPFHIFSQWFGARDGRERGYKLESFLDAFARHGGG